MSASDRERTWTLFGAVAFFILFIYRDIEARRDYVDRELTVLSRQTLEAKSKAEGAAEAGRVRAEESDRGWQPWSRAATAILAVTAVIGIFIYIVAYHIFGA